MNFDMHTHFIAPEFVEAIQKPGSPWQAKLIQKGDEPWIEHDQGYSYPLTPGFHDTAARLADMAAQEAGHGCRIGFSHAVLLLGLARAGAGCGDHDQRRAVRA